MRLHRPFPLPGQLLLKRYLPVLCITFLLSSIPLFSGCGGGDATGSHHTITSPTSMPSAHSTIPPSPTNLATPSTVLFHSSGKEITSATPPFYSITMIDATTGWATTQPGFSGAPSYPASILRTTDGGNHWQNVTPQDGWQASQYNSQYFFNATTAWVAVSRPIIDVYRTTDGGNTWQETTILPAIQDAQPTQITFVNPLSGWIVLFSADNGRNDVAILHTTDGGKTWSQVSTTGASSGQLPTGGGLWGVSFLNDSVGWATSSEKNSPVLFRTDNAGRSWQAQTLTLPSDIYFIVTLPPAFFSDLEGILPLLYFSSGNTEGIEVYTTRDGGVSWLGTPPQSINVTISADVVTTSSLITFRDMTHGWAVDANGTPFYVTTDGGNHWTNISATTRHKAISALSFVSATIGWAIDRLDHDSSSLIKTEDGGQTWHVIFSTHLSI